MTERNHIIELLQKGKLEYQENENYLLLFPNGISIEDGAFLKPIMQYVYIQGQEGSIDRLRLGLESEFTLRLSPLEQMNIILAKDANWYIKRCLGTNHYLGFRKQDFVLFLIKEGYSSLNCSIPLPIIVKNAENCYALVDVLKEKADLTGNGNFYYLEKDPIEFKTQFVYSEDIPQIVTTYQKFDEFFDVDREKKIGCFKGVLAKTLICVGVNDRLVYYLKRVDEIFKNTKLAYQRFCTTQSQDMLSLCLQKASLELMEKANETRSQVNSGVLVLATNIIGFGMIDYQYIASFKTIVAISVIIIVNIVYSFILRNGLASLAELMTLTISRKKSLLDQMRDEHSQKEIIGQFNTFEESFKHLKLELEVLNWILWIPFVLVALYILFQLLQVPLLCIFKNIFWLYKYIINNFMSVL